MSTEPLFFELGTVIVSLAPDGSALVTACFYGKTETKVVTPKRLLPGEFHLSDEQVKNLSAEHQATPDSRRYEMENLVWCKPEEHGNLVGWRKLTLMEGTK